MNVTYLWIRELVTFFRKVFVYSAQKVANMLNMGYYVKIESSINIGRGLLNPTSRADCKLKSNQSAEKDPFIIIEI